MGLDAPTGLCQGQASLRLPKVFESTCLVLKDQEGRQDDRGPCMEGVASVETHPPLRPLFGSRGNRSTQGKRRPQPSRAPVPITGSPALSDRNPPRSSVTADHRLPGARAVEVFCVRGSTLGSFLPRVHFSQLLLRRDWQMASSGWAAPAPGAGEAFETHAHIRTRHPRD